MNTTQQDRPVYVHCDEVCCVYCMTFNTLFTLLPWPWPSKVLFTLGELYPRQTGKHRRDCRRGSRRGSSVNTYPRRANFFVHMCYMQFKAKFGEGLVRLNVNGIFRQQCMLCRASVNWKARSAMAKLVRLSVNRELYSVTASPIL